MNGFAGVFDGQQHTIYGMYSQHGMFISLCYGGTIKNLNKDASVVNGSENSDAVGGLVGAIETRTSPIRGGTRGGAFSAAAVTDERLSRVIRWLLDIQR